MTEQDFSVALDLQDGYTFEVDFEQEQIPTLLVDELPPLGEGRGPSAARLLAAAVGNCMSASLLYCLRRARIQVGHVHTRVEGTMVRNEQGRLRIGALRVLLQPDVPPNQQERIQRCLALFEDFCIVGQSVRQGIDLDVTVAPVETNVPA